MKLFTSQSVQLKGLGIPGMITSVLPIRYLKHFKIEKGYVVLWVDGTEDVRMAEELSVISDLTSK